MPSPAMSPVRRDSDIARLCAEELDVLVVGGGVVGAGSVLDAVSRGLSAGVVEAQDWASGTSSRSTKLVHGGLRYLQMMDFKLVHEALKERDLLLRHLAPHLVQPVPILYPLRHTFTERPYVGAGIAMYDLMGWSAWRSRRLPLHRHLSKKKALAAAPGLRPGALVGAVEYYDAQVDDARFVLELVRTAVSIGAIAVNRLSAVGFLHNGGRVSGAKVRDAETGAEYEVRARVTVIATGAWTEETEALAGREKGTLVRPSKGVHLVVPKAAIESSVGLILRTQKSVLFVLPWGHHWLIGTTDTDWPYDKARPVATAADIDYLLGELNSVLAKPVYPTDVEAVFAGLRPLVAGVGVVRGPGEANAARLDKMGQGAATTKLSREHAVGRPRPGLVVVSGGKYTTYRVMAMDAINAAVEEGGFVGTPGALTDQVPLFGAEGFWPRWHQRARLAAAHGLSQATVEHLLRRYGGAVDEVLAMVDADRSLARPIDGAEEYLRAEIVYGVTHEGARHLEDLMLRRSRIGVQTISGGEACAEEVADLAAPLLGWDETAKNAELEDYLRWVTLEQQAASVPSDEEAAGLVAGAPALLPLP